MTSFTYSANPVRVLFGSGTVAQLPDEVHRLGASRVLLLGRRTTEAAKALGSLVVAEFDGAAQHTPVEVTERAMAQTEGVDCVVAVGGGSTTGLAKALALRTGLPQIIVPTTYAGSEVTSVLGQTVDGKKSTTRSEDVRAEVVVYDVDLTLDLPAGISAASGVNALAHAVEAVHAPNANPVTDQLALRAIRLLTRALPRIAADPADRDARTDALQGAWLAGTCLDAVSMGLHHRLAHILGGTFGLPHAETHTILLPHTLAHHEVKPEIAEAMGVGDAPSALHDLITRLPVPKSLRELGLAEVDLAGVDGPADLLRAAWEGTRPAGTTALGTLTDQVVASFDQAEDPRTRDLLQDLVRTLHGYAIRNDVSEAEWLSAIDFLTQAGHITDDKRQEFILLSDTLGVSSIVDLLTNSRTPDTTPSAVLGPFYVDGPPAAEHGTDLAVGLPGTPLWVDATVQDTDGNPVADAVVDVWQSNEDGFYDVQLPDLEGPVLRARFHTDSDGAIRFWTILPAAYPIPADGPVGRMLKAVGRHPYRAPHLHFMIAKPGHRTLITQLFVGGGDYLDSDTVFGVKDALIVDFAEQHGPTPDGRGVADWHRVGYTFRIGAA
jgi:alcohol dehydrogenase class IV/protocatechuate 3,4-dioxygenase beta subunit